MRDFTDTSYHIVFGCDDNYTKYVAVTMQSIITAISSKEAKFGGGASETLLSLQFRF
ncbi:hypothetical protein [uncultured Helicobacter sp.]|uniref:hypothetical protein n=1 Tax=uncultured Helicobacter sp. TaxID=175537 RepID=UPI00374F044D